MDIDTVKVFDENKSFDESCVLFNSDNSTKETDFKKKYIELRKDYDVLMRLYLYLLEDYIYMK